MANICEWQFSLQESNYPVLLPVIRQMTVAAVVHYDHTNF